MRLRINILCSLFFVLMFQGCETCKGAFTGAGQGFKKDVKNISSKEGVIWKTDKWMQDHMW